ncbi:WD40 repeat domain-containing protein [Paenibacillus radicis (ex Gao et al. 2016)]|uniref:WD40 repeat domain-containing protein n=1 Tax=Paenibacillus radicis (ex Gao et al. 2016) TaxID=1737354 RepID=A0A917H4E1_9BACL|nr:WD40 repeat domain-containing protein [Paenibacillus radicis (ex Gao et al. 2016)]GGG67047.1 hypothetical protein GCM10010918_22010 [Paenibacillus radicis (ex Gao et al. 2016)]
MNIKHIRIGLCLGILLLILSGCMSRLRSETIIIPDTAEEVPEDRGGEAFEVRTIYRLPSMHEKSGGEFRWSGPESLVRVYWGDKGNQTIERYAPPYEKPQKLLGLDFYTTDLTGMSPDGRYFAGFSYQPDTEDGQYSLSLVSLSDVTVHVVDTVHIVARQGPRALAWSDNSRFLSYFSLSEQGETEINVYDTESQTKKSYTMPDLNKTAYFYSVKLSEDGSSALIVKAEKGKLTSFVLGRWKGSQFVSEYEHTLHDNFQVDWLDKDRIAFVGTDGTLFTYDRRNSGVSVLLDQVGSFELSKDRQYIAYTTEEATIDVAKLQGNNLLNKKSVYRGFVATQMAWSPDNGALFIQGRKPYDGVSAAQPAAPKVELYDNFNNQSIIVAFKR